MTGDCSGLLLGPCLEWSGLPEGVRVTGCYVLGLTAG